ncbi:hypothetical protein CEUSTIGMA_g8070.t1 [Chlamydomonas eustigma]|uniref:Metallo-beta-lactamase domain-containing protein n=1 Tax=Chlamydomonas eustigma TaxID=1157962 RepID=A0A250XC18_9CHLO|nr:hypothetical protein CEUSTIGMA_g8070.t1 [Chlamydomonas eustigma]|eukprot:GAX80635.1 hypothetical protein CEUSTIGMA_g8070.t1 [Chlamydomonas eustigma]
MLKNLRHAVGSVKNQSTVAPPITQTSAVTNIAAESRSHKLNIAGFEVEGLSIAGQETCVILPRFKVIFDSGRCPQRATIQQTILLSHGHLDHIGGIPFHITTRNMQGMPASKIVSPPACESAIRDIMSVYEKLQGERSPIQYQLTALTVGQQLHLPGGFIVRPFPTTHSIASQGYLLYSQRKKLRADLQGSSQEEIKAMRMAGLEVTEVFEVPEVAFTGDTTIHFLEYLKPEPPAALVDALRAGLAGSFSAPDSHATATLLPASSLTQQQDEAEQRAAEGATPSTGLLTGLGVEAEGSQQPLPVSENAVESAEEGPRPLSSTLLTASFLPVSSALPPAETSRSPSSSAPTPTHQREPSRAAGDDTTTTPSPSPLSSVHALMAEVLKAKLLIMELTFIDDLVSVEDARAKGHMHIADFVANAHLFQQNEAILLIHFSARYSRQQILEALDIRLPAALRAKCVPFLNGFN